MPIVFSGRSYKKLLIGINVFMILFGYIVFKDRWFESSSKAINNDPTLLRPRSGGEEVMRDAQHATSGGYDTVDLEHDLSNADAVANAAAAPKPLGYMYRERIDRNLEYGLKALLLVAMLIMFVFFNITLLNVK